MENRTRTLDETDRALLELLQDGLALSKEPYHELGLALGVSAKEVLERIGRLKEEGLIRRLSGFFSSAALGYQSVLCAMTVQEEHIERMAALIRDIPGVTHNYLRDHQLNMWFTLCCRNADEIDHVIEGLEKSGMTEQVFRFTCLRQYKVRTAFKMREEGS